MYVKAVLKLTINSWILKATRTHVRVEKLIEFIFHFQVYWPIWKNTRRFISIAVCAYYS